MGNNPSSTSKVMGVRVPLPLYMEILQTASENKMTITDYALQLLIAGRNKMDEGGRVKGLLNTTQEQCRELRLENIELQKKITELEKIIAGYRAAIKHRPK
jgi:hypothetical protein